MKQSCNNWEALDLHGAEARCYVLGLLDKAHRVTLTQELSYRKCNRNNLDFHYFNLIQREHGRVQNCPTRRPKNGSFIHPFLDSDHVKMELCRLHITLKAGIFHDEG